MVLLLGYILLWVCPGKKFCEPEAKETARALLWRKTGTYSLAAILKLKEQAFINYMLKLGWVDFNTYCPIMLKNSDEYFVFDVAGNADFDNAKHFEKFVCYPVNQNGEVDLNTMRVFTKEDLQAIPVPV